MLCVLPRLLGQLASPKQGGMGIGVGMSLLCKVYQSHNAMFAKAA